MKTLNLMTLPMQTLLFFAIPSN